MDSVDRLVIRRTDSNVLVAALRSSFPMYTHVRLTYATFKSDCRRSDSLSCSMALSKRRGSYRSALSEEKSRYTQAELQAKLDVLAEKYAQLKNNAKGPDKPMEAGKNKP